MRCRICRVIVLVWDNGTLVQGDEIPDVLCDFCRAREEQRKKAHRRLKVLG